MTSRSCKISTTSISISLIFDLFDNTIYNDIILFLNAYVEYIIQYAI